jgi:hypothetical protein
MTQKNIDGEEILHLISGIAETAQQVLIAR